MKVTILAAATTISLVAGTSALGFSANIYAVCRLDPKGDNFLALRSGPSSKNRMLMKLGPGTVLEDHISLDRRGKWMRVYVGKHGGPAGWVYSDYVCLTEDH